MIKHPFLAFPQASALAYIDLVRTYVELDVPYLLDMPYVQGRVRLTNIFTGEYVIYGKHGMYVTPRDVGIDELLYICVPKNYLRVHIGDGVFQFIATSQDIDSLGIVGMWAMLITDTQGVLNYEMERIDSREIDVMRQNQYKVIRDSGYAT